MDVKRLLGADFLRALACLMVLVHHLLARTDIGKAPDWIEPLLRVMLYGTFGVSIFFVLSGFLLARPFWLALDAGKPMPSLPTYFLRRAARILPGFWLALTVTFLVSVTLFGAELNGELVTRFLAGFLLVSDWHWLTLFPVEGNGPLWSIGFEVSSYAMLPLAFALLFRLPERLRTPLLTRALWVVVIGLVLCLHWQIYLYLPIDDVRRGWEYGIVGGAKAWVPSYNPIGFFGIFCIGALAAGLQVLIAKFRALLFDLLGLAAIAAVIGLTAHAVGGDLEGYGWLGIPYAFPAVPLATGVALAALPSSLLGGRLLDNPLSRYVAQVSFGVYVWHFLLIGLMAELVPASFNAALPDAWPNFVLASLCVTIASFLIATASFHLMELPVVRWARTLEGGRLSLERMRESAETAS